MEEARTSALVEGEQALASTTTQQEHPSPDPPTQPVLDEGSTSAEAGGDASSPVQMDIEAAVAEQEKETKAEDTSKDQVGGADPEPIEVEEPAELIPTASESTIQPPQVSSSPPPPPPPPAPQAAVSQPPSASLQTDLKSPPSTDTSNDQTQEHRLPRMMWVEGSGAPKTASEQAEAEPNADVPMKDAEDTSGRAQTSTSAQAPPLVSSSAPRPSSSLPTLNSSWPSKDAFFASCQRGLREAWGVNAWKHTSDLSYGRVVCSKKFSDGCRFVVSANRREDGRWNVNPETTFLDHSHEPRPIAEGEELGDEEDEIRGKDEHGSSAEPHRSRRATPTIVIKDSDDDEESVKAVSFYSTAAPAEWTLTSRCKAIRQLVAERETIFDRQRTFNNDHLQGQSLQQAQQYLDSFQPSKAHPSPAHDVLRIYYQFCANQHLPSFPINPSVVALCIWWGTVKAPAVDFYPFVVFLNGAKNKTSAVWEERLGEEEAGGSLMSFKALEEFLMERGSKGVIDTASPVVSSATPQPSLTKPQAAPSSSKDETPSQSTARGGSNKAPHIPRAPKVGDRFADPDAAVEHVRLHVVPVLGVGVGRPSYSSSSSTVKLRCWHGKNANKRCFYQINLVEDEDKGDWVVDKSSTLRHDHGPRAQIIADPNWRPPTFTNRRSTGRRDRRRASSSSTLASGSGDDDDESDEEDSDQESIASRLRHASPRAVTKRAHPAPVVATSSKKHKPTILSYNSPYNAPYHPQHYDPPSVNRSSAKLPFPSPAPSLATTSSRDPTPSIQPRASFTPSSTFHPTLSTFLSSLNPRLSPLASALFEGGLKDISLLVRFIGVEEELQDTMLGELKGVGLLQKHLLKKELKAAKESGWATKEG